MPHGTRLSLNVGSMARERIRGGRLPLKFSMVVHVGHGAAASCNVCARSIERDRVRHAEDDVRDGGLLMFHLARHAACQLECLKHTVIDDRNFDECD